MPIQEKQIEKLLYDRKSAACALSVSIRTIDYLLARQELEVRRIGKKTLIPAASLRKYAAANHYDPVSGAVQRGAA
jgi:hypothetical protein